MAGGAKVWEVIKAFEPFFIVRVMSEKQVPYSVEQRIIIHFFAREGVKQSIFLPRVKAQFDSDTLSRSQRFENYKKCLGGAEAVENESHKQWKRRDVNGHKIQMVREVIEQDRRVNVSQIAFVLGINVVRVHKIISDHLVLSKV